MLVYLLDLFLNKDRLMKPRVLLLSILLLILSAFGMASAQDGDVSGDIVVWGWPAAIRDTIEGSGVLDDFKAAYPNVNVEIVYYEPTDLYTNLPLALTAGTGACDVCLIESSHLAEFVHLGGLADMTEQVQPYVDIINDYRWTDAELDGRLYAMPWDSGPVVMYYRRDVLDNAGLPSEPDAVSEQVATWDGYLDMCRTIKEETGLYCFANNRANNSARLYEMMLWSQGLGYYDADTGDITIDSPENVATLETLGQFWDEDLVSDSLEWTDPWYAEFASLDAPIATFIEASWMDVFLKSWIAPGTEGLWGVARMPAYGEGGARAANDGGSTFVIPEQSQNKDAAWAFIEFVLGRPESQIRIFQHSGFFPSLETTYDDPAFEAPDPFFADQATGVVYAAAAQDIPDATVYGPNYRMMNGAVATAIQRFAAGEATAEQALADAAEEVRANVQ